MQRHLKTFLLHHELKHKEGFINDPESPGWLSVALVNWTIVCSSFASLTGIIHYVFSSCQPSLLQIHHVLCFCTSQFRTQFDSSGWTVWIILGKSFQSNVLNLRLRVIYCLKGNEKVFVFGNRCGEKTNCCFEKYDRQNQNQNNNNNNKKNTLLFTSNVAPLNRVIASCSKLHSALLLQPLVGHQKEAPNLFELRGEVQPAEAFRMCLLLGFHLKMFTNATAGSSTGRKEI